MAIKTIDGMFPIQKLPMRQKGKVWRESCVDMLAGKGDSQFFGQNSFKKEMKINYDLYNSVFDQKDLKYVTNPFNVDEGFPASPQNFNIIRPKINLLLGEETKRPTNLRVVRTSDIAGGDLQEKQKQMLIDYMQATIMSKLSPEDQTRYQEALASGEIMPPEQIQKYMSKSYKDVAESVAYHTLNYLKNKLNLNHEFMKTWLDALVAGVEVLYVGVNNGDPFVERVNPLDFSYDASPDLEFIEDGEWCCRKMLMTYTEVYDRLYDKMEEKDLNKLIEMTNNNKGNAHQLQGKTMLDDFNHLRMSHTDAPLNKETSVRSASSLIEVYHVCWKSYKKIGFVSFIDEMGDLQQVQVDENYVVTGNEVDVIWDWVIEVWEGYKIGNDLYIGIQPIEYQHISFDNPNSQKLPYTGAIYNNVNSKPKSLVELMKPLQYMYIIVWYRLELALAKDKGKVLSMDITQIPKSMNIDPSKWAHYINAMGVNFFNPYETGFDIPGRDGSTAAAFNQFTALDLSMAQQIDQYVILMDKIERMIAEISGVSDQREGSINQYELVNNVNKAITQSALITEPLFWVHDQVKKRTMTMLLNTAKEIWRKNDKKKLNFILDDGTRAFINLSDQFFFEDFDIFISDSTKDVQNLEMIKALYQPAMQNGASLLEITEIMTLDNITLIKEKLEDIEKRRQEREQQLMQAEQESQAQLVELQNQAKEQELMIKEAELELGKYKVDQDNQTKIVVAEIGAYRFQEDLDANNNGIPDPIEIADYALRQREADAAEYDQVTKNNLKMEELKNKSKEIESKRQTEKEKMQAQKELQKQKDDAAMAREQLKAKTALKNKVAGEK